MPGVIEEVFQPLRNEVIDILFAWRLYHEAFVTFQEWMLLLIRT